MRTALTVDMWDAINGGYIEMQTMERARDVRSGEELGRFLDCVKQMSLVYDGSAYRTMLRNDAYCFSRSGFLSSAPTTRRGCSMSNISCCCLKRRWSAARSTISNGPRSCARSRRTRPITGSIVRAFKPWLIADLLILRPEMPRSLISCYENMVRYLDRLANTHGRQGPAQRHARAVYGKLEQSSIDTLFQGGLHEFVGAFIADNTQLGTLLSEQYMF